MTKHPVIQGGIMVFCILICAMAIAEIPNLMHFQGRLSDSTGNPVTGKIEITFSIYDAEEGGTAIWSETDSVTCENGMYSIVLGLKTTLNLGFEDPYWLGLQVSGDAEEMSPRYRFATVPYAYRAMYVDTAQVAEYAESAGVATFAPGDSIVIRNTLGEIVHILTPDGLSRHTGVATFEGGLYVPDLTEPGLAKRNRASSLMGGPEGVSIKVGGRIELWDELDDPQSGISYTYFKGAAYQSQVYGNVHGGAFNTFGIAPETGVTMGSNSGGFTTWTPTQLSGGSMDMEMAGINFNDGSYFGHEYNASNDNAWANYDADGLNFGTTEGNSTSQVNAQGFSVDGTGSGQHPYTNYPGVAIIDVPSSSPSYGVYVGQNGGGSTVITDDYINTYNPNGHPTSVLCVNGGNQTYWGNLVVYGNLTVYGSKTATVETQSYGHRALYCDESAEIYFFDRGQGRLENGQITVQLDPVYLETVTIDADHPMLVQITLTSDCNGVFISEKTGSSFTVKELMSGTSGATFDWEVAAKRKDYENVRLEARNSPETP